MENLGEQIFVSSNRTQYNLRKRKRSEIVPEPLALPGGWSSVGKLNFLAELAEK